MVAMMERAGPRLMTNAELSDPDVALKIRLVISRKRHLFDKYQDINDDSLFADMLGELSRCPYHPSKSSPGTFAYRVASARLIDILRRRTNEDKHQAVAMVENGVRADFVTDWEAVEGTDAEMIEQLRGFYAAVKDIFDAGNVPPRLPRNSPPDADRIQRAALLMLQQHQGWTSRQAQAELKKRPNVLAAIGVTYCPSHMFFCRAARHCNIVAKNISQTRPSENRRPNNRA